MTKLTILCIDDQREVLAALQKDLIFFESVCDIVECESASEAWEVIQDLQQENLQLFLVVCDHIMPGENGVDFLARLQQEEGMINTKKILLTGLADQQDTIKAINKARIDLYIEKPWDGDELISSIKDLLADYVKTNKLDKADFSDYLN